MGTPRKGMTHLNSDLMCAVDCETTGSVPGHSDLYQVAVLPLNADLRPWKEIVPFYCDLQLKREENIQPEVWSRRRRQICAAQVGGLEPYRAADLFDEWFKRLGLGYQKRIVPLAQNWPHDRGFMIDWLGHESFEQYFSPLYRDTMMASLFCNDRADFQNELPVPFSKNNLKWLTRTLRISHDRAHDALQDCIVTAEVYRRMCSDYK